MQFGLLGPVEVWTGERVLVVPRPFRRAVLAYLLLHAGRLVAADQLVEALWGGAPPTTARTQVHVAVSRIRGALRDAGLSHHLVTRPSGYLIEVGPGQLDLDVFRERVDRARASRDPTAAVDEFRRALSLWRGPALADAAASFVEAARSRLEDVRITVHEELLDLELTLGRHKQLVAELGTLVDAHPLRERLTGQLMLALFRCGRQAEALAAYHTLRSHLATELGLEPGRELRERHDAILRDDPDLGHDQPTPLRGPGPAVLPRQLPAPPPHFAGRGPEIEALTAQPAQAGTVVISAIDGTAGIGKTALAVHVSHLIADRYPDGQLYVNLRGFDPAGVALSPAEAVRGFLDALQVVPERIPNGLDAQAALYRSLVAGRRMLVVLDNARDPDHVRPLLPASPSCLTLITSRNRLLGLIAVDGARPVTLDLLSPDESRELLARRIGGERTSAEPGAVDEIVAHCARLPLALSIVAARAVAEPRLRLAALAAELGATSSRLDALDGGEPAADVRSVLSWSYERLKVEAAGLFRLLGLHPGPEISTLAAASLAGASADQVRPLLTTLARAHLVAEPVPGRYALHDLLRTYAAELGQAFDGEAARRTATDRMVDHYLHSAWHAANRLNPHRDPVPLSPPQAGVTPEPCADSTVALDWFGTEHQVLLAVSRVAAERADLRVGLLAWSLTDFFQVRGHWHDWLAVERSALATAQLLGDPAIEARAHRGLASAYGQQGRLDEAQAHLEHALVRFSELGDHSGQGYTHLGLSWVFGRKDEHEQALHHAVAAHDHYRSADQPARQAIALNTIGWYHTLRGDHQLALEYCQQALALQDELGDLIGAASTWDSLGHAHHHLGHHREAVDGFLRAIELFRSSGDRFYEAETLTHLGDAHLTFGGADEARDAWRRALNILTDLGHPDAAAVRDRLQAPESRH